ncbi:MAG: hypothetical protein ACRD68_02845, partial [Pyrinomonadaceae bacterium]
IEQALGDRRNKLFETQSGMAYLAQQTGGFAVRNTNDIAGGVRRALDDQRGYYLIGYRPDEKTFDSATGRRRFVKIEVRVKRPGLRVRTRSGFYNFTEAEAVRPVRRTRAEQMFGALSSPFSAGGVGLRLTSLFASDEQRKSFMASLMHIDGRHLTFTEEADGWRKTVIDVLAVTFGDKGETIDQLNRTETIRARGDAYEQVLRGGLVFTLNVPVKKPGAYQLRVAVRDAVSERVGSASQFVEVPDLGKARLALSGIVVSGGSTAAAGAPKRESAGGVANSSAPADTAAGALAGSAAPPPPSRRTPSKGKGRPPAPNRRRTRPCAASCAAISSIIFIRSTTRNSTAPRAARKSRRNSACSATAGRCTSAASRRSTPAGRRTCDACTRPSACVWGRTSCPANTSCRSSSRTCSPRVSTARRRSGSTSRSSDNQP